MEQQEKKETTDNKINTGTPEMTEDAVKKEERRQYWFVIRELTGRELKRRYSRSKLGVAWSILNPLLTMAVLSMVFSQMFSRSIENFPIYYLCGYIIWSFFVESTNSGMTALVDNRTLLIKVKMPMDIFMLSRVYTSFVNLLYSLVAFVAMLVVFRILPTWRIVFFPVIIGMLALFCLGLAYMLTTAYVFFGDIKHLWGVATTLWMYLSAIFYPVDMLPGFMQKILGFNPIYVFIDSLRHIVMWSDLPTVSEWARMILFSSFSFMVGKALLKKNHNKIIQKL